MILGFGIFFVAFLALWMYRHRLHQRRLFAADRAIARGQVPAAREDLLALARGPFPALGAAARYRLAVLANAEGRFLDAVNEADVGIGLCNRGASVKALTNDLVAPSLLAERAFALAATDRIAEAETELAHLAHGFPSFAQMSRATFRVRLLAAVRKKDLATAARIALSRTPELPLDLKTDLLADAALAASGGPMSAEERDRIALELRAMPDVDAWVTLGRRRSLTHARGRSTSRHPA